MDSDLIKEEGSPPKTATVLAIDDDRIFLEELSDVLASSGYEVVPVTDSCGAIEAALKVRPKVILMDIQMPGKSGFEIAHEMQGWSDLADIPIIAMSGYFKENKPPFMEACGIRKFLKKPFNPLDIIWEIEDALKRV